MEGETIDEVAIIFPQPSRLPISCFPSTVKLVSVYSGGGGVWLEETVQAWLFTTLDLEEAEALSGWIQPPRRTGDRLAAKWPQNVHSLVLHIRFTCQQHESFQRRGKAAGRGERGNYSSEVRIGGVEEAEGMCVCSMLLCIECLCRKVIIFVIDQYYYCNTYHPSDPVNSMRSAA